jgi:hypothetical protein
MGQYGRSHINFSRYSARRKGKDMDVSPENWHIGLGLPQEDFSPTTDGRLLSCYGGLWRKERPRF